MTSTSTILRRRTRHRGAVLILVIGILVLLALMGTAYVSAVRLDRVSYTQTGGALANTNAWPTPPGSRMDNAMVAILGATDNPLDVANLDLPSESVLGRTIRDLFLNDSGNVVDFKAPGWRTYDAAVAGDNFWLASRTPRNDFAWAVDNGAGSWETLSRIFKTGAATFQPFATPWDGSAAATFTNFQDMKPTALAIPYPTAMTGPVQLAGKTRVYPALQPGAAGASYLAADTDGDGIADAALYDMSALPAPWDAARYQFTQVHQRPLPAVPLSVTGRIYAAVRVVDNSAALNLNTAYSLTDTPYDGSPTKANYGFFRSNIGMFQTQPASWPTFMNARMGATGAYTDRAAGHNDFEFTSHAEMLETQVGRRMDNTGLNNGQAPQAFASGEMSLLAYHGGMLKPGTDRSSLESTLYDVLFYGAGNFARDPAKRFRSYPADAVEYWYESHVKQAAGRAYSGFNYDGVSTAQMRSQFVGANPMTNLVRPYSIANAPLVPTAPAGFEAMPAYDRPMSKVGINTATFAELWRGFWNVMCLPTAPATSEAPLGGDPARWGSAITGQSLLELRAALAAVNAEDMRDLDENVTSRNIVLNNGMAVTVYGSERQPFIQSYDGDSGPNAERVVLYNPYTTVISLAGYQFASFDGATLTPIGPELTTETIAANGGTTSIDGIAAPPAGDLVLLRPLIAGAAGVPAVPIDGVDMTGYVPGAGQTYSRATANWQCGYGDGSISTAPGGGTFPVAVPNLPPEATAGTLARFPFGGFARAGDVMLVPYVGSYRAADSVGGALVEIIPITWDVTNGAGAGDPMPARFVIAPGNWTTDLLDFFTAQTNPNSDYLPNVAPTSWTGGTTPEKVANVQKTLPYASINDLPENELPVHGLINLNMASPEILARLPLKVVAGSGIVDAATNIATGVGDDIDGVRTGGGPFTSLLDFSTRMNALIGTAIPLTSEGGVFTPATPEFLPFNNLRLLNRVSNIATVRSDSFTVYVLVQAWQDPSPDSGNLPVLLGERRAAYFVDRSAVTETSVNTANNVKYLGLKLDAISND